MKARFPDAGVRPDLRRARVATLLAFFVLGASLGTWAARVPAIKEQAGLSDGRLGLALLAIPLGTILALQANGRLLARFGSGPVVWTSGILLAAVTPVPAFTHSLGALAVALLFFGVAQGVMDTAMNAQSVIVERGYGKPILSSFHACFSFGGLVGAVLGAWAAYGGLSVLVHFSVAAGVFLLAALLSRSRLLPGQVDAHRGEPDDPSRHAKWSKPVVLLGIACFCGFVGEGGAADWSAVYLRDHLGAGAGVAALGYAAFSVSMTLSRSFGDVLQRRVGRQQMLQVGCTIGGAGLAVGLLVPSPVVAIAGWGLLGLGIASTAPILFGAAGNLPGVSPGGAIARVTSIGYAGVMLGPPIIGGLASVVGLRSALFLIVALAFSVAALAGAALSAGRTEEEATAMQVAR